MDKINVLLFAMTGFGNNAFNILMKQPFINLSGVFTSKRLVTPFPYYKCEHLYKIAQKYNIPLYEGLSFKDKASVRVVKNLSPDLIVVSSFGQVIPQAVINIPKFGIINIHPSLLPKYRGATPTVWALMNGEKETGVTIHFIENEQVDCGRIILQTKLKIGANDTDGSIRCKLAKLSEKTLVRALHIIIKKGKKVFLGQNELEASYYPKRTVKDAEISLDSSFKDIVRKIRAMSPYPGARLAYNGERYIAASAVLINDKMVKRNKPGETGSIIVDSLQGKIKFRVRKENK